MTWLTGWTRRKIKIVENLTVSNYQMKLIIHKSGLGPDTYTDIYLGGNCRDDFADLRFTGPDQTTLLSYWIESIVSGVATVWIKIPTLTPTNNIYIYYDNLSATSLSNGLNTFDFFDDMSINTIGTNWFAAYKTPSISGGTLSIGGGCTGGWAVRSKVLPFNPNGYVFQFKNRINSYAFCADTLYAGIETSTNYAQWNFYSGTPTRPTRIGFDDLTVNTDGGGSLTGVWYKIVGKVLSTGTVVEVYDGTTLILTASSPSNYVTTSYRMFFGYFSVAELDDVILRKYASPEPTFGVSGTEELNITAIDMILNTNTCTGPCQIIAGVTWQNIGSSSITFTPAILIDGTTIAYATSNITIGPSPATGSSTITTPTLLAGTHQICPYPN